MLDLNTFGKTPAANYLARRLIELDSKKLSRACTVRVNAFNTNVAGVVTAVTTESMETKVAANLLRLLREEATGINLQVEGVHPDELMFVDNLLRNVIIGNIKSAMRKTSVMRKIENGSKDINTITKKGSRVVSGLHIVDVDYYIMGHHAGYLRLDSNADTKPGEFPSGVFHQVKPSIVGIEDPTTPELLHKRSLKRCKRQGKEWANGV
jgi:hypothetical protein